MASNPNSQKKQQPFKWERILVIVQDIWTDKFPNDDNYDFSIWAEWESRISKGREEEEKRIAENIRQMESRLTPEQKESMPDDWFVDDYRHTYEVSNSMYAALVVSLWSCMEGLLKDLVGV